MSSSTTYRAVCPLCQTVLVSSDRGGGSMDFAVAIKAMHAHLTHSCDKADGIGKRQRELVADNSIEAIEGAA
jgi:hypothetical protein